MIYMTTIDGPAIAIVEPGNLDRLRGGKPLVTPDRTFIICYTPDMKYFEDKLGEILKLRRPTTEDFDKLLIECKRRKAVVR